MKPLKTLDRRLVLQCITLGLLTILPVIMIGVNGSRALQAVFMSGRTAVGSETVPAPIAPVKKHAVPDFRAQWPLRFGVYDPENVFAADKSLQLRHVYVSWAAFDPPQLEKKLASLESAGLQPLLTIEPWPTTGDEATLLTSVAAGKYDSTIDRLANSLQGCQGPVYLIWGHEMDQDLVQRYPWSKGEPAQYIAAYRHVVDRIRQRVKIPLVWIWSGVLKDGSLHYWPGDDYVDLVGMPIYSFPAWDQVTYGYIRDFRTTFEEKRQIVAGLNKPQLITELGVSGNADFDAFWLHQAFQTLDDYPDLVGVVFFYATDHEGAWGREFPTPDWRVHPDSIRSLVAWKRKQ